MIEEKMIKDIICYEKLLKKFVRGALSNRELNPALNNTFRPIAQNIFFSSWNFYEIDQISFLLISILRKKTYDLWFLIYSLNSLGRFSLLLCSCKRALLLEAKIAVKKHKFQMFCFWAIGELKSFETIGQFCKIRIFCQKRVTCLIWDPRKNFPVWLNKLFWLL